MLERYPEYILEIVRQQKYALEESDNSKDFEIQKLEPDEIFDSCLQWECIMGYTETIKEWIEELYKVDLNKENY